MNIGSTLNPTHNYHSISSSGESQLTGRSHREYDMVDDDNDMSDRWGKIYGEDGSSERILVDKHRIAKLEDWFKKEIEELQVSQFNHKSSSNSSNKKEKITNKKEKKSKNRNAYNLDDSYNKERTLQKDFNRDRSERRLKTRELENNSKGNSENFKNFSKNLKKEMQNPDYINNLIGNIENVLASLYGSESIEDVRYPDLKKKTIDLITEGSMILKSLDISDISHTSLELNTSSMHGFGRSPSVKDITKVLYNLRKNLMTANKKIGRARQNSLKNSKHMQEIENQIISNQNKLSNIKEIAESIIELGQNKNSNREKDQRIKRRMSRDNSKEDDEEARVQIIEPIELDQKPPWRFGMVKQNNPKDSKGSLIPIYSRESKSRETIHRGKPTYMMPLKRNENSRSISRKGIHRKQGNENQLEKKLDKIKRAKILPDHHEEFSTGRFHKSIQDEDNEMNNKDNRNPLKELGMNKVYSKETEGDFQKGSLKSRVMIQPEVMSKQEQMHLPESRTFHRISAQQLKEKPQSEYPKLLSKCLESMYSNLESFLESKAAEMKLSIRAFAAYDMVIIDEVRKHYEPSGDIKEETMVDMMEGIYDKFNSIVNGFNNIREEEVYSLAKLAVKMHKKVMKAIVTCRRFLSGDKRYADEERIEKLITSRFRIDSSSNNSLANSHNHDNNLVNDRRASENPNLNSSNRSLDNADGNAIRYASRRGSPQPFTSSSIQMISQNPQSRQQFTTFKGISLTQPKEDHHVERSPSVDTKQAKIMKPSYDGNHHSDFYSEVSPQKPPLADYKLKLRSLEGTPSPHTQEYHSFGSTVNNRGHTGMNIHRSYNNNIYDIDRDVCNTIVREIESPLEDRRIVSIKVVNDKLLAVGFSQGEIVFYDVERDFEMIVGFQEHSAPVSFLETASITRRGEYSMDGIPSSDLFLLSAGGGIDCSVAVWDTSSFTLVRRLTGHEAVVTSIRELQDGCTVVTGSVDSRIAVWSLGEGFRCVQIIEGNDGPITCLEYSSEERHLCSGSSNGVVVVWLVVMDEDLVFSTAVVLYKMVVDVIPFDVSMTESIKNAIIVLGFNRKLYVYSKGKSQPSLVFKSEELLEDFFVVEQPKSQEPIFFGIDSKAQVRVLTCENADHRKDGSDPFYHIDRDQTYSQEYQTSRPHLLGPRSQLILSKSTLLLLVISYDGQCIIVNTIHT